MACEVISVISYLVRVNVDRNDNDGADGDSDGGDDDDDGDDDGDDEDSGGDDDDVKALLLLCRVYFVTTVLLVVLLGK